MPDSTGRQLSFLPESPDEDGDQLDLIEEAGTETLRVDSLPSAEVEWTREALR
jgi:hypothetical protein